MEKVPEAAATPPQITAVLVESTNLETKTPPSSIQDKDHELNSPNPAKELRKPVTPDRLKLPKAFRYPERYRSPTDMMMSPITKGILARTRRGGGALLPPSRDQLKIQDTAAVKEDVGLFP